MTRKKFDKLCRALSYKINESLGVRQVGTILYDKQAIVDRFQQLLAKYKKVRPDKIIEKKTPKRKG